MWKMYSKMHRVMSFVNAAENTFKVPKFRAKMEMFISVQPVGVLAPSAL